MYLLDTDPITLMDRGGAQGQKIRGRLSAAVSSRSPIATQETEMSLTDLSSDALKVALKEALVEALQEQRELFREILAEALEEFALAEAIREGLGSNRRDPQGPAARGIRLDSSPAFLRMRPVC